MAINLLELVQSQLSGPILQKISGLVGESEAATKSAVGVAVPSLLAGMMKQASTPSGANALASTLDSVDTGILGNLGSALSGGGGKLMETGSGLVKNLFGGSLGSVTDVISKASGVGKGAIGSLLGMLAPILFGVLGKQKAALGLDAGGLANLLSGQKSFLSGLLPAGLTDTLGLGNLFGGAKEVGRAAVDTGRTAMATAGRAGAETVKQGSSLAKKLLPLLLIAVLGFIAWRVFSTKSEPVAQAAMSQVDSTKRQLTGVLESATAALSGVRDAASAKAALPRIEDAARSVGSMASSLGTMPATVRDAVGQVTSSLLPGLKAAADKALALPGVSDVLKPAVTQLLDGIAKLKP